MCCASVAHANRKPLPTCPRSSSCCIVTTCHTRASRITSSRPEFADGQLVGCAGSELHGSAALLRSVAVNAEQRSCGVGAQLVKAQLEAAKNLNATRVSLLTTTANTHFPRFGFAIVQHCTLAVTLNDSLELRGACPDSAICLHLSLEQRIYFV